MQSLFALFVAVMKRVRNASEVKCQDESDFGVGARRGDCGVETAPPSLASVLLFTKFYFVSRKTCQ
jgi:hypothetical protein